MLFEVVQPFPRLLLIPDLVDPLVELADGLLWIGCLDLAEGGKTTTLRDTTQLAIRNLQLEESAVLKDSIRPSVVMVKRDSDEDCSTISSQVNSGELNEGSVDLWGVSRDEGLL